MANDTSSWVEDFLPVLQCPVTHSPLRHASEFEKKWAGIALSETALANEAGTHVYPMIEGMLRLLPDDARTADSR